MVFCPLWRNKGLYYMFKNHTLILKLFVFNCVLQNVYDSLLPCRLTSECLDTINRIGLSPRCRRGQHAAFKHSSNPPELCYTGSPLSSPSSDLSTLTINSLNLSVATTSSDFVDDVTFHIQRELSEELLLAIHSTVGHMLDISGTTDTSTVVTDVTVS